MTGKAGDTDAIYYAVRETSLGMMLIACTDRGLRRVAFGEGVPELRQRFPKATITDADANKAQLIDRVVTAIEEPSAPSNIPLDARGTPFQHRVWQALETIPAGETRSYGELAAIVGNAQASRAVGGANGANPIAVLIPCHRVIASDGSLGGYAYGLDIKRELLRRESLL